jgi:hypothetical protein
MPKSSLGVNIGSDAKVATYAITENGEERHFARTVPLDLTLTKFSRREVLQGSWEGEEFTIPILTLEGGESLMVLSALANSNSSNGNFNFLITFKDANDNVILWDRVYFYCDSNNFLVIPDPLGSAGDLNVMWAECGGIYRGYTILPCGFADKVEFKLGSYQNVDINTIRLIVGLI